MSRYSAEETILSHRRLHKRGDVLKVSWRRMSSSWGRGEEGGSGHCSWFPSIQSNLPKQLWSLEKLEKMWTPWGARDWPKFPRSVISVSNSSAMVHDSLRNSNLMAFLCNRNWFKLVHEITRKRKLLFLFPGPERGNKSPCFLLAAILQPWRGWALAWWQSLNLSYPLLSQGFTCSSSNSPS